MRIEKVTWQAWRWEWARLTIRRSDDMWVPTSELLWDIKLKHPGWRIDAHALGQFMGQLGGGIDGQYERVQVSGTRGWRVEWLDAGHDPPARSLAVTTSSSDVVHGWVTMRLEKSDVYFITNEQLREVMHSDGVFVHGTSLSKYLARSGFKKVYVRNKRGWMATWKVNDAKT